MATHRLSVQEALHFGVIEDARRRQRRRRLIVMMLAVAVLAAAVAGLALDRGDGGVGAGSHGGPRASVPPAGTVLECVDRVEPSTEGGQITPRAGRDALVGPVAFYGYTASYRAARPKLRGHTATAEATIVRDGTAATVIVPAYERDYLSLSMGERRFAAALNACHHRESHRAARRECGWKAPSPMRACTRHYTFFQGGLSLDVKAAPQRGACATLDVRVADRRIRRRLLADRTLRELGVRCRGDSGAPAQNSTSTP